VLAACGRSGAQAGPGGFPPAPVSVQQVKPVDVPIRFEYVGQTAGSKEAEVRARVQGILEKRTYQEGGAVKAGQTLFVIDARPYAAQVQAAEAELAQAQAQYAQARRNLERVKPLADSQAISRREYDEAVSSEERGEAAVKQAQARLTEARLNLGYTTVSAPVTGFASRAQKSEGSLVSPGQDSLLTTVSQLDPIHVNFSLSEQERERLARVAEAGAKTSYEVALRLSNGKIFPRKGKLGFIDTRINTDTGAYDAQAVLPNGDYALRPGQFVRVVLEGAVRSQVIVVPQRAVMDGPQGKFVFVATKGEKGNDVAVPRPVTVGDWVQFDDQQQWIIESGLQCRRPGGDRRHGQALPGTRWRADRARPATGCGRPGRRPGERRSQGRGQQRRGQGRRRQGCGGADRTGEEVGPLARPPGVNRTPPNPARTTRPIDSAHARATSAAACTQTQDPPCSLASSSTARSSPRCCRCSS
jgi:membrane fusion protein, multidrug efflux system